MPLAHKNFDWQAKVTLRNNFSGQVLLALDHFGALVTFFHFDGQALVILENFGWQALVMLKNFGGQEILVLDHFDGLALVTLKNYVCQALPVLDNFSGELKNFATQLVNWFDEVFEI
ncbi:hypothetical protein H5410_050182 [Solanum commersonii]|uniref:Uncharacterized protein n=1 Tax=Solanum commersonii TaxID=4109 RepID=A0A9J5WUN4_SOLCO|nr:hypothetical protein H5410_050182 [Solanum commersonii]